MRPGRTMLSGEVRDLAAQEEGHWWFRARRRVLARVLERCLARATSSGEVAPERAAGAPAPRGSVALDVGCGAAVDLRALPLGDALRVGVEAASEPLAAARRAAEAPGPVAARDLASTRAASCGGGTPAEARIALVRAAATRLPLREACAGVALALDVLEHLDDDAGALAEIARVLLPGGVALITVPAWPSLWSEHDEALGHRRRYRRRDLARRIEAAGLRVERASYFNALLFAPAALYRLGRRHFRLLGAIWGGGKGRDGARRDLMSDTRRLGNRAGRLLEAVFASERFWVPYFSLPVGLSLLVVARRPE